MKEINEESLLELAAVITDRVDNYCNLDGVENMAEMEVMIACTINKVLELGIEFTGK